jgi:hypothetical protein
MAGSRVLLGGLRFYPAPTTGGLTGEEEWMPKGAAAMQRGLALLRAFGGEHVKMVFPLTFAAGAELARLSVEQGLTISGHCAHPLAMVSAGMTAQEHADGQCRGRGTATIHNDRIELLRKAGIWTISTAFLHGAYSAASRELTGVPTDLPFVTPRLRLARFSDPPDPELERLRLRQGDEARRGIRVSHEAGLSVSPGTDAAPFPDAMHGELKQFVAAGYTPMEALKAATSDSARMLGLDAHLGTIAPGKVADLVILDVDPAKDISNTRRIWRVIQGGKVIDRDRLRQDVSSGR